MAAVRHRQRGPVDDRGVGHPPPAPAGRRWVAGVEHAARLWDGIAIHLWDAYDPGIDPGEISEALRSIHVQMCADVQPDPEDLVERLVDIIGDAEAGSCLDLPDDYLAVVGPAGVAALSRRRC